MSAGWVGASVRARLLLGRRVGAERAAVVASRTSLEDALAELSGTAYGRAASLQPPLEAAQRAIASTLLLELRLLAGWLPRRAAEGLRALAAWFEIVNIEDRLAYALGDDVREPFELGVFSWAWPRAASVQTPEELSTVLRSSTWGDPRGTDARAVHLALRVAWGRKVIAIVPEARRWAAGALALLAARELFVAGDVESLAGRRIPELGEAWAGAASISELRSRLGRQAGWTLDGIVEPEELWTAEAGWWRQVEADATRLAHGPREGRGVVIGAAALLAADAARVSAALAVAARGRPVAARAAFDALV
jgi:hypothetical protein